MESMRFIRLELASKSALRCVMAGAVLFTAALFLLPSCGASNGQGADARSGAIIEGSRVKSYSSISELSADSQLIVVADATANQSTGSDHGIPYTVTVVSVREALKGTGSQSLQLRQLGNGTTKTAEDMDALVAPGRSYVLFLDVFTYGPGQATDQYVVVGGSAGMYQLQGQTLQHVRGPDPVPQSMSLMELKTAIAH